MTQYTLTKAAILAQDSYRPSRLPGIHAHMPPRSDAEAYFLSNGTLLVPGSNSLRDYLKYNVRLFRIGAKRYKLIDPSTAQGASGLAWHQGFLAHAAEIYNWLNAKRLKPRFIIGHSLGAASAQILTMTYRVPGIGFAAPRPLRDREPNGIKKRCLLFNRNDDDVTALPTSFHHLGEVRNHAPARPNAGIDHNMRRYREALNIELGRQTIPRKWPR